MFHKAIGVTTKKFAYGEYRWDVNLGHNQLSPQMFNSQKYRVTNLIFLENFT